MLNIVKLLYNVHSLLICADVIRFACNVYRFDALIISAEIGHEKPSREIFDAALSMFLCFTRLAGVYWIVISNFLYF